jgi:hypothetical protein
MDDSMNAVTDTTMDIGLLSLENCYYRNVAACIAGRCLDLMTASHFSSSGYHAFVKINFPFKVFFNFLCAASAAKSLVLRCKT